MHLSDLKKHVACCPTFGFNALKMPLTLPQGALQPCFHIDVKIMENKLFVMFKDTVRTNRNMCTLVTSKNMLLAV